MLKDGEIRRLYEDLVATDLHSQQEITIVPKDSLVKLKICHDGFTYATFNIVGSKNTFVAKQADLLKSIPAPQ